MDRVAYLAIGIIAATVSTEANCAAPKRAPKTYVTENYALTFRVPQSLTYCPLPANWVGSDHGTYLFLEPPKECDGTGFPSTARRFEPDDTPRIEVFYGYAVDEDGEQGQHDECTDRLGLAQFMGGRHPLCRIKRGTMVAVTISAKYRVDEIAEVSFSLVTTEARLKQDLGVFEAVLSTTRSCTASSKDNKGHKMGSGAPCPKNGWF